MLCLTSELNLIHMSCNARTGSLSSWPSSFPQTSVDPMKDTRGRWLIDECTENDLLILNGSCFDSTMISDNDSGWTSFQPNSCAVIDYVAVSVSSLSRIQDFTIANLTSWSDHAFLSLCIGSNSSNEALQEACHHPHRPRLSSQTKQRSPFTALPPIDCLLPELQGPPSLLDSLYIELVTKVDNKVNLTMTLWVCMATTLLRENLGQYGSPELVCRRDLLLPVLVLVLGSSGAHVHIETWWCMYLGIKIVEELLISLWLVLYSNHCMTLISLLSWTAMISFKPTASGHPLSSMMDGSHLILMSSNMQFAWFNTNGDEWSSDALSLSLTTCSTPKFASHKHLLRKDVLFMCLSLYRHYCFHDLLHLATWWYCSLVCLRFSLSCWCFPLLRRLLWRLLSWCQLTGYYQTTILIVIAPDNNNGKFITLLWMLAVPVSHSSGNNPRPHKPKTTKAQALLLMLHCFSKWCAAMLHWLSACILLFPWAQVLLPLLLCIFLDGGMLQMACLTLCLCFVGSVP